MADAKDTKSEDNPFISYVKDMVFSSLQELGKESAKEMARHLKLTARRIEKAMLRIIMSQAILFTGVVFLLIALVLAIQNRTPVPQDISFMIGGLVALVLGLFMRLLLKNQTEVK